MLCCLTETLFPFRTNSKLVHIPEQQSHRSGCTPQAGFSPSFPSIAAASPSIQQHIGRKETKSFHFKTPFLEGEEGKEEKSSGRCCGSPRHLVSQQQWDKSPQQLTIVELKCAGDVVGTWEGSHRWVKANSVLDR